MKFSEFVNEEKIDEFNIIERQFSDDDNGLSIGLANIHAIVPAIELNKSKIERASDIFKRKGVNIAVFPEFCLAGYFWEDQNACWPYMDEAIIDRHWDWVKNSLESKLDSNFKFIIFNNIRRGPSGQRKYYNSTYIVNRNLDYKNPRWIYDKTFLPGIENTYTVPGEADRLVIEMQWGRFGFTSCYDFCFSQLYQEMSQIDKVDAVIQIASWRGTSERDYPGMNVSTDTYYGDLWDMLMDGTAARNQIWIIAANAVGKHGISGAIFWGGSGLWAPSGMKLTQASHSEDELLILHNVKIKEEVKSEKDDFDYTLDFNKVYDIIDGKRSFTRL